MLLPLIVSAVIVVLFVHCTRALLKKANRPNANKYLIGSFGCMVFSLLSSLWLCHYHHRPDGVLLRFVFQFYLVAAMCIAPLFFFFVMHMFDEQRLLISRYRWMHVLPILPSLVYVLYFCSLPVELRVAILSDTDHSHRVWVQLLTFLFAFSLLGYNGFCALYIYKAWQREKRQFRVLLNHVKFWLFALSGCATVLGCLFMLSCLLFNHENISRLTISYLGGTSVLLLLLIPMLINSQSFVRLLELIPETVSLRQSNSVEESQTDVWHTKLEELMIPALFCQRDFSETVLATHMDLPRHKLSEFINEQYRMHFNEFVNTHRVEYFCRLIENEQKRSQKITVLALECGFSSDSTFYEAFKKIKKKTPNVYVREKNKIS